MPSDNYRGGGGGGGYTPRQMVQGNWKCADCGKEITELPFSPRPGTESTIFCRECYPNHKKKRF